MNVPLLQPDQLLSLDAWLRSVLWECHLPLPHANKAIHARATNLEIHRLKGRLSLSNGDVKIIQGVREVFEIFDAPKPVDSTSGTSLGKIVLIGRDLQNVPFQESFISAIDS